MEALLPHGPLQATHKDRACRAKETRGNVGRGGVRRNRRTSFQRIIGCLTLAETGILPHSRPRGLVQHIMPALISEDQNASKNRQRKR